MYTESTCIQRVHVYREYMYTESTCMYKFDNSVSNMLKGLFTDYEMLLASLFWVPHVGKEMHTLYWNT